MRMRMTGEREMRIWERKKRRTEEEEEEGDWDEDCR